MKAKIDGIPFPQLEFDQQLRWQIYFGPYPIKILNDLNHSKPGQPSLEVE